MWPHVSLITSQLKHISLKIKLIIYTVVINFSVESYDL
jgi:hypothetical protein